MKSERKYSLLEAKHKLEAYCAYQERSSFEVQRKMITWGLDLEDQERLLADLISNNFLSEERFAEAFASGKYRIKKWGRIKIQLELKARKISKYSIDKALKSIDEEEYWKNLVSLAERKWDSSSESDAFKKRAKVYRYLSSKGYETDLIKDAVDQVSEG